MAKMGRNEISWVTGLDQNGELNYTVTSNEERTWYYIYDKSGNRLGKSKNPTELENKYFWRTDLNETNDISISED